MLYGVLIVPLTCFESVLIVVAFSHLEMIFFRVALLLLALARVTQAGLNSANYSTSHLMKKTLEVMGSDGRALFVI